MSHSTDRRASRATFLRLAAATTGTALVLGHPTGTPVLAADTIPGICTDSLERILDTALLAERLATTFYYAGLTAPAVLRDRRLAGTPNVQSTHYAKPGNVKYLRATLDAESKHAALLAKGGAKASVEHFHFPAGAFHELGMAQQPGTFLGVLESLETAFTDAYAVAVGQLLQLGHPDLAMLAAQIMGLEAEHRVLGRVIGGALPANDITLERVPFACGSDVAAALVPYISGRGFPNGSTTPIAMPSPAQVSRAVGRYRTRIVTHFL